MTLERWWLLFLTAAVAQLPLPNTEFSAAMNVLFSESAIVCMVVCVWRHVINKRP